MTKFDIILEELSQSYSILGVFRYSTFFQKNGEKILYDWFSKRYKQSYAPDEKLIFIQDCSDLYDYRDDLGKCTQTIQEAVSKIDISNCFVTIITTNKNIVDELSVANRAGVNSPDLIGSIIVDGDYSKETKIRDNTFCALPWMHLYIGPAGDVLPCCAGDQDYPLGHIDQDSLETIYNNDKFQVLRSNMLSGKRTKECTHCWIKEDSGLPSPRLYANKKYSQIVSYDKNLSTKITLSPNFIDIRLNKLCNLKCRSCSPYYSSAIAQEIQEIYNVKWPALNNSQRKQVLQEILNLLPGVEEIYFAGGEPLLSPEHFAMLDKLIELEKFDTEIFYNTNFMQLSFREIDLIHLWNKFDSITLGASLDARGVEAEYLRDGTVWTTIEDNLFRLKSHKTSKIKFKVTSTVGFLNVESLINLQKDWVERKLLSIHDFNISQIIFDSYLSIQVLPEHHKKRLETLIVDHIQWVKSHGGSALLNRWQQVIDYMWQEDRSHLLFEFQRVTTTTDQHRKQNFHKIFPQFQDLLPLQSPEK